MKSKRRTFLFGAGAVYEWNSPSTSKLTEIVLESGFRVSDEKMTVTRYIYESLLEVHYQAKELNFETIISVIEELLVYYSYYNAERKLPSLLKPFFNPKFEYHLLNFVINDGHAIGHKIIEMPKGNPFETYKFDSERETFEQFYFETIITQLLTAISAEVQNYAYNSGEKLDRLAAIEQSISFIEWMKLHFHQTPLRLYTLNYDRLFKQLLNKASIDVFEGFNSDILNDFDGQLRPDVHQILTNTDKNIHYNLHGSVFWDVIDSDDHGFPNAEIIFCKYPNLPINNVPASLQIEKGKTLMVTNIITGYQKAQKAILTPFKQMQAAFDRDCIVADEIYIIGYSFGDEHINASLRSALRFSQKTRLIIVDPFFMNIDLEVAMKIFSVVNGGLGPTKAIEENVHSFCNGRAIVYTMGFSDFRKRQLNPFNKVAKGILDI